MALPGFTAEASIPSVFLTQGRYRMQGRAGADGLSTTIVMQQFSPCGPCLRPFGIPWLPGVMFCWFAPGVAIPC
jgi:hypothetical protein